MDATAGDKEVTKRYGRSFGAEADAYDRSRPGYPDDAIAWLLGAKPQRVLEIGAGTGLLTQSLQAAGHDLIAVDPVPAMVRRLRARSPQTAAAVAMAEELPVPSRWADVVIVAQAFHWFDHDQALPEIARVLRHGGQLALLWNFPDESTPWVKKLIRIIGKGGADADVTKPLRDTDWFGPLESRDFRFWQTITQDPLLDLVRSRSSYLALGEEDRVEMLAQVATLYDGYGRGYDGMQLPYLTHAFRTTVQRHPTEKPRTPKVAELTADADVSEATGPVPRPDTAGRPGATAPPVEPPEDPGTLLIDFR